MVSCKSWELNTSSDENLRNIFASVWEELESVVREARVYGNVGVGRMLTTRGVRRADLAPHGAVTNLFFRHVIARSVFLKRSGALVIELIINWS